MNTQKPEPRSKSDGATLDLHSVFFTLQGEGPFTGHRSIFVRLAGCNLQCPGCDTEYTEGRREVRLVDLLMQIDILAEEHGVSDLNNFLIVITGGEPLRQPIGQFVEILLKEGYRVQIESNGVLPPDPILLNLLRAERWSDYYLNKGRLALIVSPKTKRISELTADLSTCFKYVLDHRSINPDDGLPIKALEHPASTGVARPPRGKPIYVNPYDVKDLIENQRNLDAAAKSALEFGYICGVQLHKLLGLE